MTLEARDKLINDLIKENRDVTIKDYLEVCKEVIGIEEASDVLSVEMKIMKRFINTTRSFISVIR